MELSKVCTGCKVTLSLDSFGNSKKGKHGKVAKCKTCCHALNADKWKVLKNDESRKSYQTEYNKARWQAFKSSPEFNQVTEQQRFFRKNRIHNLICSNNYDKAVQLARDYDMDVEHVEIEIETRKQILKHFNL